MNALSPPARSLVVLRMLIGATTWLAPNLAARLFFIDPHANPNLPFIARLFGIRDVVLGLGVLFSEGEPRKLWLRLGVLTDSVDAAAATLGFRGGTLSTPAGVLGGGAAVSAVAMGAAALAAEEA
jgi:hypothetical protein